MIVIGHTVGLIGQYPYGDDLMSLQYDSSSGLKMLHLHLHMPCGHLRQMISKLANQNRL